MRHGSLKLIIILVSLLGACTHRTIQLETTPSGAQAFMTDGNGNRGQSLGQTPIKVPITDKRKYIFVEVEKPGYAQRQIFMPMTTDGEQKFKVTLTQLSADWFDEALRGPNAGALNQALRDLLRLQSHILAQRNADVENTINQLKQKFENVSIFHSLVGNYYYLRNNTKSAAEAYERALILDGNNEEAKQMLNILRGRK